MRRAAWLLLFLCACDGPAFDSPSRVLGPRVLGAVAEPPEAAPGDAVALSIVTALAPGATVEWTIDLSPSALAASAGQTLFEAREPVALQPEGSTPRRLPS